MHRVLYRFAGSNYSSRKEGAGGKFCEGQLQFLNIPRVGEHVEILDHSSISLANTSSIDPQHNGTYVVDRVTHSLIEQQNEIILSLRKEY